MGLLLVSFMVSAKTIIEKEEIGRYKIEVTTYVSLKTNKLYVLETTFDTKTGNFKDKPTEAQKQIFNQKGGVNDLLFGEGSEKYKKGFNWEGFI